MDDRDWGTLSFSLFLEDSTTDVAVGMNEKQGFICDDPTDFPTDSPGYVVIEFLGEVSDQLDSFAALSVLGDSLNAMARAAGLASPDGGSVDPVVSVTSTGTTVCGIGTNKEVSGANWSTQTGQQTCRSRRRRKNKGEAGCRLRI